MIVNNRDSFWDCVKGVAIILVVLGHSIQYGSGQEFLWQEGYFSNRFFQLIYSFHMPLFMLVSGFFFNGTLQRYSAKDITIKKIRALLIPIISFSAIKLIVTSAGEGSVELTASGIFDLIIKNLWFLWVVLASSLICVAVEKMTVSWIYIPVIIGMMFLPNKYNLSYLAFLFPYFIIGMYSARKEWYKAIFAKPALCGLMSLVIFAVMFLFYTENDFVYTSGTCILNRAIDIKQILTDLYRFAIGLIGSAAVICFIRYIYDLNITTKSIRPLAYIGTCSLAIYCWQDTVTRVLFHITRHTASPDLLWYVLSFALAFCFSFALAVLTKKSRFTNILLFGGK